MAIVINVLGSLLGIFLSLAPLPWYGRVHNLPNKILIFWFFIINIFLFANSITWAGNTTVAHLEYCDLASKLIIGFLFAMPTASLLTSFQHYLIAHSCELDMGKKVWNWKLIEGLTSAAVPLLFMLLHLVVQDHRFDIIEDYGCMPSVFPSVAAIFLVWIPLMILCTSAIAVNFVVFKHMLSCPSHFTVAEHLQWMESKYTSKHIIREFAMTSLHSALSLTLAITAMAFYGHDGVHSFPSLAVVHKDIHKVFTFTSQDLRHGNPDGLGSPIFVWWIAPLATFIFTALNFGAKERAAWVRLYRWTFYAPPQRKWKHIRKHIPTFAPHPTNDEERGRRGYDSDEDEGPTEIELLERKIRAQARMRSSRLDEIRLQDRRNGRDSKITDKIVTAALTDFPPGYRAWKNEHFQNVRNNDRSLRRTAKLRRERALRQEQEEIAALEAEASSSDAANAPTVPPKDTPPSLGRKASYKMAKVNLDIDASLRPLPSAHVRK